MRTTKVIHVVSCHAEGEVGDVIVGGVAPPPGDTVWEQSRFIARDETLRNFVLNEPRGGVFRHVNLLVPPKNPQAQMGWIIMEPADTPPMSGSNAICVATVLLETGIVPMQEPETRMVLEAPGGLVEVVATCRNGKAERIGLRNVPSFADKLDARIDVPGLGTLTVDTAYGGDSFVIADAHVSWASRSRPTRPATSPRSACGSPGRRTNNWVSSIPRTRTGTTSRFARSRLPPSSRMASSRPPTPSSIRPGKIDRSPCGTGCSARMAVLHAKGRMAVGDRFVARSIIGSRFDGRIEAVLEVGGRPGITPEPRGPRLDHGHPPTYAGPWRPLSERLPPLRHLAARVTSVS